MKTTCLIAFMTAMLCFPFPSQAQTETHYPITPRLVARALSNNGMETADEQVTLPAPVVATEPYPALDILSVEPLPNTREPRSTVKLACHAAAGCLPFFAIVAGLQPATTPANAALKITPPITMKAGTHAILVMDDHIAHIQVAVITLENGAPGKWIRVASPDRKQYYRAEVLGANLLRGDF